MDCTHIPEISCFYSDTIASHILNPSAHFEYEMILITDGAAQVRIHDRTYQLQRGSLLFISRLEQHQFCIAKEPYCRYVLSVSSDLLLSHLNEPRLASIFMQRPEYFSHVIQLNEEQLAYFLPFFRKSADEYEKQPAFYTLQSIALLLSILISLYRLYPDAFPMEDSSSLSAAVLNAQIYVSRHFNRKLTLQEIADQCFLSRHTLSLAFKEIVGITFKEYLLLFRITEAKKLLLTTDLSIAQIGESVGYINVNNFLKIFREKERITPLQYRKQYLSH